MEYNVIYFKRFDENEAIRTLNNKINELLSYGWQTQGGVCIIQDSGGYYHVYQAIVHP